MLDDVARHQHWLVFMQNKSSQMLHPGRRSEKHKCYFSIHSDDKNTCVSRTWSSNFTVETYYLLSRQRWCQEIVLHSEDEERLSSKDVAAEAHKQPQNHLHCQNQQVLPQNDGLFNSSTKNVATLTQLARRSVRQHIISFQMDFVSWHRAWLTLKQDEHVDAQQLLSDPTIMSHRLSKYAKDVRWNVFPEPRLPVCCRQLWQVFASETHGDGICPAKGRTSMKKKKNSEDEFGSEFSPYGI